MKATMWRVSVEAPRKRDGRCWIWRVRPPHGAGTDRRKSSELDAEAVSREEAERGAAELAARLNAKTLASPRLADVVTAYAEQAQGLAAQTIEKVLVVRDHVERVLGDLTIAALDKPALLKLQDDLRATCAGCTVNTYLALLAMAWEWSRERGHVQDRDLPKLKRLPEDETERRPFTPAERVAVLEWAERRAKRWYPCLRGLNDTGARAGEFLGAKHGDLDRATGALVLRRTKRKNGLQVARTVFMSPETVALFTPRPRWCPLVESNVSGRRGRPLTRHAITGVLVRAFRELGLPREELGSHSFRRSWVEDAERARVPRVLAMRLTGHSTEEIYLGYQRNAGGDLAAVSEAVRAFRASSPTSSPGEGGQWQETGSSPQESQATRKPMFGAAKARPRARQAVHRLIGSENPPLVALGSHPVSRAWPQREDTATLGEIAAMGPCYRRLVLALVRDSALACAVERVWADLFPNEWTAPVPATEGGRAQA